jgi:hypothetical protein
MQRCSSPRSMDYLKATRDGGSARAPGRDTVPGLPCLNGTTLRMNDFPVATTFASNPLGYFIIRWSPSRSERTTDWRISDPRAKRKACASPIHPPATTKQHCFIFPATLPYTQNPGLRSSALLPGRGPWHPGVGAVAATANPHPTNNTLP